MVEENDKKKEEQKNPAVFCPNCNEKLEDLKMVQSGNVEYIMDKKGRYEVIKSTPFDDDQGQWYCPFCGKKLFDREATAILFLNGKDVEFDPD